MLRFYYQEGSINSCSSREIRIYKGIKIGEMLLCIFTSIDITQLDLSFFLVLVNITVAKITNTYFIHFQMEYVFVDNV
jgi:hypothetical protein